MATEFLAKTIRRLPFGGTVSATSAVVVGASGGTGVTAEIPDLLTTDIPILWELQCRASSAASLLVRDGPASGLFTAAAGAILDNYDTLEAGTAYSYSRRHPRQEIDLADDQMLVLNLRGSGGTATFSGWVTFWRQET